MNVCKNMKLEVLKTLDYPKAIIQRVSLLNITRSYIVDHVPIISKVFKDYYCFLKQIKGLFCQCGS
jgi:hypothetical protein